MPHFPMSAKELDRHDVLKRLLRKEFNGAKAASLLRITTRQVRRLKHSFKHDGAKILIHGNRGKPSNRRLKEKERIQIQQLVVKHYQDFTPTFAAEKLREKHGIDHDPKTIEAVMVSSGAWQKKNRHVKEIHRAWRQRRPSFGELIQFDGSYHHWLENRGGTGEMCLLAAIDDATSRVTFARLAEHEGVLPVFSFWQDYLIAMGKPRAIYMDKFSTYKMNSAVAKDNPDLKTQFQRAMEALRIEPIFANSPQAKGRVERLFRTLQDRLVKELRLQKITTIDEANRFITEVFIPDFNRRFSVEPAITTNLHTPLSTNEQKQLPSILSRQEQRTVHNDYTIAFNNDWYQILASQFVTVCKGDQVTIEEHTDGSIHLRLRGKDLAYAPLPERPKKIKAIKQPWILATTGPRHKPSADHPWKRAANLAIHQALKMHN
jgi:Winged helix-turn helix